MLSFLIHCPGLAVALWSCLPGSALAADVPAEPSPEDAWVVERARAWVKLYGYVRFFHPSDQAAEADMDAWACAGARAAQGAEDPGALRAAFAELLAPIAPSAQLWLDGEAPPAPLNLGGEGLPLTAWQHYGFGQDEASIYASVRSGRTRAVGAWGGGNGWVTQQIDAAAFAGRAVRLSARGRTEDAEWKLWMRTYDAEGGRLDSYTSGVALEGADWSEITLEGAVGEGAAVVQIGAFVTGNGAGTLDAFTLAFADGDGWSDVAVPNADFSRRRKGWDADSEGYTYRAARVSGATGGRALRVARVLQDIEPRFEAPPPEGDPVYALGAGLSARIPIALPDGREGTLPAAAPPTSLPACGPRDAPETTLAAVAVTWNVFQHFYPYWDVVEADEDAPGWETALNEALASAAEGAPQGEILDVLVERLRDGHGGVYVEGRDRGSAPVALARVEEQLVVVSSSVEGVARGDVVTTIDGAAVEDAWATHLATVSGSPQWKDAMGAERLTWGNRGETLTLGFGEDREVTLTFGAERPPPAFDHPEIHRYDDGLFYVDLNRASWSTLEARLEEIAAAPAVVFDLRRYPNSNHAILNHLIDAPVDSDWMSVPHIVAPDHHLTPDWSSFGWQLEPAEPRIGGTVVFLISGRAISYAESVLGYVEGHQLGALVGSATAGANGNVNPFEVPGGYRISWTGMRVLKHDGGQQHNIGVLPTHPAAPTVEGVRAGRDEVLERGLEVARGG